MYRMHVYDVLEILDIGCPVIVRVRGRGGDSLRERNMLHTAEIASEEFVGLRFYPTRDFPFCRSPMRRVILETTRVGRIMGRSNYDAIAETRLAATVVSQNRMRNHRRWRVVVFFCHHDIHAICR